MSKLTRKLNPRRFRGMSPLMAAILGFVVGESFTDPQIADISVSEAEGFVHLRKEGAAGFDGFQSPEDLRNNWNRLLDVAGLEPEEPAEAVRLFHAKVEKVTGTNCHCLTLAGNLIPPSHCCYFALETYPVSRSGVIVLPFDVLR